MKQPSFLARKTLGQPNYLLLAMAAAFLAALSPLGAWRAVSSVTNRPEQWLPPTADAVEDLEWFRTQFGREQTVLVSWDGCTLENAESLGRVARKLTVAERGKDWVTQTTTGPESLKALTEAPLNLPYREAVDRLEGILIGPPLRGAGDKEVRATCLAVELAPMAMRDEASLRSAIEQVRETVAAEQTIDAAWIRMVGAPLEDLAIDDESRGTLLRWTAIGSVLSFAACTWRLKSAMLASVVVATGVISAALSLAIVFYFGIVEVAALGWPSPHYGVTDALLLAMPMAAFVLTVAVAIRVIHYYERTRRELGVEGAAERAAVMTRRPATAMVIVMAIALGLLWLSELAPVQKFGVFTAISLAIGAAMALMLVPVSLYRFPPQDATRLAIDPAAGNMLPGWLQGFSAFSQRSYSLPIIGGLALLAAAALGMRQLEPAVQLPPLLKNNARLMRDYAWFESHIGNAIPLEIVITTPAERMRAEGESAEADGQQYRITPAERARLVQDIAGRLASAPGITGVTSAATFAGAGLDAAQANTPLANDYFRTEVDAATDEPTERDLWRLSAQMTSISLERGEVQYEHLMNAVHAAVDPMLLAYEQRDWVVRHQHERGKQLAGAQVCVLFRGPEDSATPLENSQEWLLANLLRDSGVAPDGVSYFNLATISQAAKGEAIPEQALSKLSQQDAVVLASAGSDETAKSLASSGVSLVDVSSLPTVEESAAIVLYEAGGPRSIRAVFTGMGPVAHAAERQLTADMGLIVPAVAAAVSLAMMFVMWNPAAGAGALISTFLPLAAVLGALGWLGVSVDMGVLLAASVALDIGVEGTIHYAARYRRAVEAGIDRPGAAALAFEECTPAAVDIAIVAALALTVLALSGIASMAQLGMIALPMMAVALAGNLLVLPAIVASPLGRFFARAPEVEFVTTTAPAKAAAALIPAPHSRPSRGVAADTRHDAAEDPHSALHAKLKKLRGTPRDSASS